MSAIAGAPLEIALLLTTALVVGRGALRTVLTIALVIACLALPLFLPRDPMWLRALLALGSQLAVLRAIEVRAMRVTPSVGMRMFAFVAPLDAFAITRARPRIDLAGIAYAIAAAMIGAIGIVIIVSARGEWRWPIAALGCFLFMLAAMDALAVVLRTSLRAVGIESLPVQDAPWRSRSVAESWGRRWNRAVGAWLRRFCFAPLARRHHVVLGMFAAFGASAWIHFWPVLVAVGLVPAIAMAAFFFAQALLVVIETKLGVARWPSAAAHAWTITAMLVTSPLFCVPFLLACGYR